MPYVVITGNDRKEFELLKDALEYKTGQSRIYEVDAFGNMKPLAKDDIEKILLSEPSLQQEVPKQDIETSTESNSNENHRENIESSLEKIDESNSDTFNKKSLVDLPDKNEELTRQTSNKEEKSKSYKLLKLVVLIVMIIVAIFIVYSVVQPFISEAQLAALT